MPQPNFLGIGTMRSATTFLHTALSRHPEIIMPREGRDPWNKEQHFFDKGILKADFSDYERQFSDPDKPDAKRSGEITPAYCSLPPHLIQDIRDYLDDPDVRIIFLIRNPIYRLFSDFKQRKKSRGFSKAQIQANPLFDFVRQTERPGAVLRTDYQTTLRNWSRIFGAEKVKVLTFDELTADPVAHLQELARFLKVDPDWFTTETVPTQKVHASYRTEMRQDFRDYLAWRWFPKVQELNSILGGRITVWEEELGKTISNLSPVAKARFRLLYNGAKAWHIKKAHKKNQRFRELNDRFQELKAETNL